MKTVYLTGLFLLFTFLFPFNKAYSVVVTNKSGGSSFRESSLGTTVRQVTDVVIEVRDGILYTPKNRYNLNKVKVTNLSTAARRRTTAGGTVQLIYTNGVLTEVDFQ